MIEVLLAEVMVDGDMKGAMAGAVAGIMVDGASERAVVACVAVTRGIAVGETMLACDAVVGEKTLVEDVVTNEEATRGDVMMPAREEGVCTTGTATGTNMTLGTSHVESLSMEDERGMFFWVAFGES